MEAIINDLMTICEVSSLQYLLVVIGLVFGVLILIKLWK